MVFKINKIYKNLYELFKKVINLDIFNTLSKIILIGLLVYFIFYVLNASISITYPYQIDYGEGFLLNQARLLAEGSNIYKDISNLPYTIGNYPPVYPLISSLFIKLFGVSFAIGRIISVVSAIFIGLLIFKIIKEKTKMSYIAFISTLLFFASPYIYHWTRLVRVDTLGLLLALAGVYIIYRYTDKNTKKIYISSFLFLLALFTKQSLVAAPAASIIYLLFKNRKQGIILFSVLAISCTVLFILINYVTNWQFFNHIVKYNINSFSITHIIGAYVRMMQIHAVLIGFATSYVFYLISRKKESSLFALYFIFSALVAITVGKAGAGVNYFIELIAIACILFGLFLSNLYYQIKETNKETKSLPILSLFTLLIIQLILFAHMPYVKGGTPTYDDFKSANKVSSYIENTSGPILSEDAGILLVNNKRVLFQPFVFTQLSKQGLWDDSKLTNKIRDGYFSVIIIKFNVTSDNIHEARFTNAVINSIISNYNYAEKFGDYYLYKKN